MTANVARIVGIADFVGGLDRDARQGPSPGRRQAQVPDDVLDDDDRVVHEDADREDEGEERDPVERVAEEHEDEEGQRERDRHGEQDHSRFPPAEGEGHQQRHRQRREGHVLQELVGLLRGGLAVVPRDGRVDVGGQDPRRERLELTVDRVHDRDRVGPAALADRERDGRKAPRLAGLAVRHVGRGPLRSVHDGRDVGQAHRPPAAFGDHDLPELARGLQEAARLHHEAPVAGDELPGHGPTVARGERGENRAGRQAPRGQARRIELDAELAPQAADQRGVRHVGNRLDLVLDLRGDLPQGRRVLRRAPERERPDRHVVDRAGLHERRRQIPRPDVGQRVELRADPDECAVRVLPDAKPRDDERRTRRGGRVDVLDPGNRPEGLLEGCRNLAFDLDRAAARKRREDVDHRNLDLGLLFPGRHDHGESPERQREGHEERRQLRVHEGGGEAPGDAEPLPLLREPRPRVERHETARVPAARSAGGSSTTRSPASSPDRTSTRPAPADGPVRT